MPFLPLRIEALAWYEGNSAFRQNHMLCDIPALAAESKQLAGVNNFPSGRQPMSV